MSHEACQARVSVLLAALGHGEGCSYTVERRTRGEGSRRWPWRVLYHDAEGRSVEQPELESERCYSTEDLAHAQSSVWLECRTEELALQRRRHAASARSFAAKEIARADELERSAAALEAVL